jgi:hypothetical protein
MEMEQSEGQYAAMGGALNLRGFAENDGDAGASPSFRSGAACPVADKVFVRQVAVCRMLYGLDWRKPSIRAISSELRRKVAAAMVPSI